jgi:hypothetical protein
MGSHYMGNTVGGLERSILGTNHADGFDHILKITKNNLVQIKKIKACAFITFIMCNSCNEN